MLDWSSFSTIQPLASRILVNSMKRKRLSHAYLVQGERGTGKKTFATILAMTIFCENLQGMDPCQRCHACRRIQSSNHPDVHWIQPEGRTIKNEQIDYLRKEFSFSGVESTEKVYIIDQAETLTTHAANRLLKFLEEPNVTSTAILLTEQSQAILPTIRSRCQLIDLKPLDSSRFQTKLQALDELQITEAESKLLSALTTNIDEAIALHEAGDIYTLQQLIKQLFQLLIERYEERFLFVQDEWLPQLKEKEQQSLGLELLLLALRDIIYAQIGSYDTLSFFKQDDALLLRMTERFSNRRLLHMLKLTLEAKRKWNQHVHPSLVFEQLILQF